MPKIRKYENTKRRTISINSRCSEPSGSFQDSAAKPETKDGSQGSFRRPQKACPVKRSMRSGSHGKYDSFSALANVSSDLSSRQVARADEEEARKAL